MSDEEKTTTGGSAESAASGAEAAPKEEHSWVEEIEMASDQLVSRVKELIAEGNVRRLIIRKPDGDALMEVPLTAGVAVGGVFTIIAPVLAAIGALAALIAHVKVEVVRVEEK